MSLPDNWVDRIFTKLTLAYGAPFMRQYDGLAINEVKADWAETLGVFSQSPDAIRYGLEHLPPDKAPNALQFRDLCRRPTEHATSTLKLPLPKPDPALARAVRAAWKPVGGGGPRAWAERLRDREQRGERLTIFQCEAWRAALREPIPEEA